MLKVSYVMEKTADKASVSTCMPSQGGGKLVPSCLLWDAGWDAVKGRLSGDVWTVSWPGDREMGIFHERSTGFLSAKISCLFPLPRGSSCLRHTSLECDVRADGSSWASWVTFCVPEIFKVSWDKQNSIGLPLCGWRGLSPHSGLPCPLAQVWCAQHHCPGRQHPSVRDDILRGICWQSSC